jgi:hypothetical protein
VRCRGYAMACESHELTLTSVGYVRDIVTLTLGYRTPSVTPRWRADPRGLPRQVVRDRDGLISNEFPSVCLRVTPRSVANR